MPGPCSAPNGNISIVGMKRDKAQMAKSGKTAMKKGKIERQALLDEQERFAKRTRLSRAQREQQEEI